MSNNWKSPLTEHYGVPADLAVNDGCESAKQFAGFETEYAAVRESVAISDNCHYGKFRIHGSDALQMVNRVVMADIARLAIGRATWTFMLRDDGSTLCDVYVVCAGNEYLLFSEGVAPSEVLEAVRSQAAGVNATIDDLTRSVALIGLDGPYAWELLKNLVGVRMLGLRYLEFLEKQPIGGGEAYVIRAGKTGEFGYQIMLSAERASAAWNQLCQAGAAFDIQPIGFATQHLCRLENRFINMHCEGTAARNPLELNCRVMIDQEKDDYVGYEALKEAMSGGAENRTIGIVISGSSDDVPALGAPVSAEGQVYGKIVNAGYSPSLGRPIALALLPSEVAYVGLEFDIETQQGSVKGSTVSAPFIFNRSMTVRPQEDRR